MEITIRKIDPGESPQTKLFSRKSAVNSRLVLDIGDLLDKFPVDLHFHDGSWCWLGPRPAPARKILPEAKVP